MFIFRIAAKITTKLLKQAFTPKSRLMMNNKVKLLMTAISTNLSHNVSQSY